MSLGRTLPAGACDILNDEVSFCALGLLDDFDMDSGYAVLARLAFTWLGVPLLKHH